MKLTCINKQEGYRRFEKEESEEENYVILYCNLKKEVIKTDAVLIK